MGMHDRDRGLFKLKPGGGQPLAGSEKVGNRLTLRIFERKNSRPTVMPDHLPSMTMIKETLQPVKSLAERGQKGKILRVVAA